MSRWRDRSNEVILRTVAALPPEATDAERRKAVSASYPFGQRANHPYAIWCSAVRKYFGDEPAVKARVRAELEAERGQVSLGLEE